tara:strand:+ start:131 stop:583 length:453 start_codon:yes stop_codon:yes gene_type:complete
MEIQNFEDYLIYDDGVVFSEKRNIFLKTSKNKKGYEFVKLWKNSKGKNGYIHRLIAEHYLPKIEGKNYVDHIDGNKLNNNVSNLRWTTNIENCNNYKPIQKNNKSGHKNISKHQNGFLFQKKIYGKTYSKYHKNLNELLWYKFAILILYK